jgi:hypothetical protein
VTITGGQSPFAPLTQVSDRLKAAIGDRYGIDRELGAGGMATVYLAMIPALDCSRVRHFISCDARALEWRAA